MECEAITTSKSSPSERPVGSISILVVDDDLTCLSIVAAMLKKFKYQVVTVKHPKDALCTLRIKEGTFDLVVSDVHMPDMDGFELQRVIAQEFNLPVVLMSADDQEVTLSKGLESGAAFFIVKPLSSDVLKDLWRYADTKKKTPVTIQEIGSSTDEEETSSEKNNVDAITVSESSVDEDVHVKKDSKKKSSGKMASDDDKKEASVSSSPKRPKLVWTNSLHNRFLEAIRKLGLDKAVPKKILELMDVPGLTRENVASHLQKYRIFLRRVSDASYEIHYGPDMGLTHSLISSLTSPRSGSSTPILNSVTKGNYQNPGLFQDSNISRPVPNPSASSSDVLTGSGIARLLSNKENFSKPNITSPSPLVREIDHSLLSFAQNGYQTSPNLSKYDLPSASCNVSSNMGTSSSIVSTYRTKYVGYSLSNLKHLTESASFNKNKGLEPGSIGNIIDLANHEVPRNNILNLEDNFLDENTSIYDVLAQFAAGNNNDGGKQLSDIIQDYQMLISDENLTLQSGMENGVGLTNGEDACSPLFDLDELDTILPNEQSLDGGEMYFTTLADQPASENQQQAQQVQQCHVSQETDTTSLSQANQIDQQARNRDFSNSLEFNASPQLDNIFLFPTEGEDEEFLESLLASFPGENPLMESNQV